MKILPMTKMNPQEVTLVCSSAMHYMPQIRRFHVMRRRNSSFLAVIRGKYRYILPDDSDFFVESGEILYLPCGGIYRYEILSEETECIQFELDILQRGEPVCFFPEPTVVMSRKPEEVERMFTQIVRWQAGQSPERTFRLTAALWNFCAELQNSAREKELSGGKKRIAPAVAWLEQHYMEPVAVGELAERCFLSESQLRRLFRSEWGISPVEYKNRLRMQAACRMLKLEQNSVSEIAGALGFSSVYSFSQEFRKAMGFSPTQYVRQSRVEEE